MFHSVQQRCRRTNRLYARYLHGRLCDQGDDRNAVDERGRTPLHVAAEKGLTRVVDRLLEDDEVCKIGCPPVMKGTGKG